MVISGGNLKPDTLKPKEVVSLLLDDDEIESKCEYKPRNEKVSKILSLELFRSPKTRREEAVRRNES